MAEPQVTVLVPAYNSQRYLREALDSICNQEFDDFECVVVNDGSTDTTGEILEEYARRDRRVRVIHQENQGIAGALNTGLEAAKGQYIAEMDHDDIAMVHRLGVQSEFLDTNPDVVLVAGGVEVIDTDGSFLTTDHPPLSDSELRQSLFRGNPLHHGSVMYRREAVLRVGGYRDGDAVQYIHDFDLWLRLAEVGQLAAVPRVVFRYRIHPKAVSATFRQKQDSRIRALVDQRWEVAMPSITARKELRATLKQYGRINPRSYASAIQRRTVADRTAIGKELLRRGYWLLAGRQLAAVSSSGFMGARSVVGMLWRTLRRLVTTRSAAVETPWTRARKRALVEQEQ